MHLKSVRVRNHRSFEDSAVLLFSPGFNLVVGANNVGKSSLLLCLSPSSAAGDPHKSLVAQPHRDDPIAPVSRIDFEVITSGDELRKMLLRAGAGSRFFPWPSSLEFEANNSAAVWTRILSSDAVPLRACMTASRNNAFAWMNDQQPTTRLYEARFRPNGIGSLRVDVEATTVNTLKVGPPIDVGFDYDFGYSAIQQFVAQIYRFDAARLSVGEFAYGGRTDLAADARNLPEVLNALQGNNPERFREYTSLVKEVFPTIKGISVRPHRDTANVVEIVTWQVDPALQRDDLAVPVNKSGTGVGQVLAMLYVVKTSDQPRTIVIDEPGSFLHPGAARSLIGIFRQFPQHQYIVATHSPEIIAELDDAHVTILRWDGSKTAVEQAPKATSDVVAAELAEVGAKLSDVYGYDNVLWVEGTSDASALRVVLEVSGRRRRRTAIMPVRDTGSFTKRSAAEVLAIYRTLSSGNALLPPALAFLFDREGRKPQEIADLEREGKGRVRFLKRRLFENYLINDKAITEVYNEAATAVGVPATTEADVNKWITANGTKLLKSQQQVAVFSEQWTNEVHAAELLQRLFVDLSGSKLEYRKAVHTPRLAGFAYKHDPATVDEIIKIIDDVLG